MLRLGQEPWALPLARAPQHLRRRASSLLLPSVVAVLLLCSGAAFTGIAVLRPRSPALGAAAASGDSKDSGITPVVDDSDFVDGKSDGFDGKDEPVAPPSRKKFESLLKAADKFAVKKERTKRQTKAITSTLEDDLMGRSIEDELDLTISMEETARRVPKLDTTLEGRFKAWVGETYQMITNPTPFQVDYVTIFLGSATLIILAGIFTVATGRVRLRGQINTEERQQAIANSPFYKRIQMQMANRERFMKVDDITTLSNEEGGIATRSQPLLLYPDFSAKTNQDAPELVTPKTPTPTPERGEIRDRGDSIKPRAPVPVPGGIYNNQLAEQLSGGG